MFHGRNLNNKINRIHERDLRIAYKDNVSTFEKLLEMDNSVTVHQRNLQLLMVEIYKTNISPGGHSGLPGSPPGWLILGRGHDILRIWSWTCLRIQCLFILISVVLTSITRNLDFAIKKREEVTGLLKLFNYFNGKF